MMMEEQSSSIRWSYPNRIREEFAQLEKNLSPGCSAKLVNDDDMSHLQATIEGPADCPYTSGTFHLLIRLTKEYPFKPPDVKLTTKIYHQNVLSDGRILVNFLKQDWSPAFRITTALSSIQSMLSHPGLFVP